jgi:protein O-GlcNAc transferase
MSHPSAQAQRLWAQARKQIRQPQHPRLAQLAIAYFEQALALEAHNVDLMLDFAEAYARLGHKEKAIALCERALRIAPQSLRAQWALTLCQIPPLYETPQEIEASRAAYAAHLTRFAAQLDLSSSEKIAAAADALSYGLPFYLAHQAQNDVALQRVYGAMQHRVFTARYPKYAAPPRVPSPSPQEPVRVGIVADEFRNHSVWKVILDGWVTQLHPARIALYGYYTGERADKETQVARAHCRKFVHAKLELRAWAETIRADRLHVLIYSAIGMAGMPSRLAALHLAPVQCVATGHALTSGLPSMDYCLSGAASETEHADAYYTEQLVRLPNLGIYYQEQRVELADKPRAAFGLRDSAIVYFMPHALFKFLPQYDFIFPTIARAVGDCQFVFLQNKHAATLTRQFEKRVAHAFANAGMDARQYVVTQPRLNRSDYQTLQHHADIYLDSLGYGGMTATLETLAHNLPIVTRRGESYRNNFSAALLHRINVTETLTATLDEYVARAIRLGTDPAWRADVRAKIAAHKHLAYHDHDAIEGLEIFLAQRARGH